jgi:3-deoxy-7-phosphoheptulonate synthase
MLITLRNDADPARVQAGMQRLGLWTERLVAPDGAPPLLLVSPCSAAVEPAEVLRLDGVAGVCVRQSPHPRLDGLDGVAVEVAGRRIGAGEKPVLMAGPCSVESPAQIAAAARAAAAAGACLLRGGAFKPRTSPYSFAGHGATALAWMRAAADEVGVGVVTEVLSERDVEPVAAVADLLQIGSRNMQCFALLRAVGSARKPVLLKRGMAATVEEWLLAAEHLLAAGCPGVILCERGVRGFDPSTRNLLDLGAVALVARVHGLPVVVDPSHAVGRKDLVAPLARAAVAAGAAGLLVEFHPDPTQAKSDGPQALDGGELGALAAECLR